METKEKTIEKMEKKNYSFKDQLENGEFTRVLIIYTGGTIGMKKSSSMEGYKPNEKKGYLKSVLKNINQFSKFEEKETNFLVTPRTPSEGRKGAYHIIEFEELLDSSCMDFKDWNKIGRTIMKYYNSYDSFIVLHGTDTMAYTSSALSFMLENLNKLVLVTGSQIPLSEIRNDAYSNLLGALILAIDYPKIPEVCIYFNNKLFRGNRTTKDNSVGFRAFRSPNFAPLGKLGIDVEIDWNRISLNTKKKLNLVEMKKQEVVIIYFFPGMNPKILSSMLLQNNTSGAILLTFGGGNINSNEGKYLEIIEEAYKKGVVLVNISQAKKSLIKDAKYETGMGLQKKGVIPGRDITVEAAFTKMYYLLSKKKAVKEIRRLMPISIKGEISKTKKKIEYSFLCKEFVEAVAQVLDPENMQEKKIVFDSIMSTFYPIVCNSLAATGNLEGIKDFMEKNNYYNINECSDYDKRLPLHLASTYGHLDICKYLVEVGEHNMNVVDIFGYTPLDCAIANNKKNVIEYLNNMSARSNKQKITKKKIVDK